MLRKTDFIWLLLSPSVPLFFSQNQDIIKVFVLVPLLLDSGADVSCRGFEFVLSIYSNNREMCKICIQKAGLHEHAFDQGKTVVCRQGVLHSHLHL